LQHFVVAIGEEGIRGSVENRLQEMQCAEPVVQEYAQSIVEAEGTSRKTVEMTQVG
jgi:hypothetical protein